MGPFDGNIRVQIDYMLEHPFPKRDKNPTVLRLNRSENLFGADNHAGKSSSGFAGSGPLNDCTSDPPKIEYFGGYDTV